jgi:hypothetical protein
VWLHSTVEIDQGDAGEHSVEASSNKDRNLKQTWFREERIVIIGKTLLCLSHESGCGDSDLPDKAKSCVVEEATMGRFTKRGFVLSFLVLAMALAGQACYGQDNQGTSQPFVRRPLGIYAKVSISGDIAALKNARSPTPREALNA